MADYDCGNLTGRAFLSHECPECGAKGLSPLVPLESSELVWTEDCDLCEFRCWLYDGLLDDCYDNFEPILLTVQGWDGAELFTGFP